MGENLSAVQYSIAISAILLVIGMLNPPVIALIMTLLGSLLLLISIFRLGMAEIPPPPTRTDLMPDDDMRDEYRLPDEHHWPIDER